MTEDLTADLFHCCALTAFVAEARSAGGWPDAERTRRRAYALYEAELRIQNAGKHASVSSSGQRVNATRQPLAEGCPLELSGFGQSG
jgi:hypothetical protein